MNYGINGTNSIKWRFQKKKKKALEIHSKKFYRKVQFNKDVIVED